MSFFIVGEHTRDFFQKKIPVFYANQTTSTNDWAKDLSFSEEIFNSKLALILTDFQTLGRGRGAHTWSTDSSGTALLCSWIFDLEATPSPVTSIRIGLALYRACLSTWPWLQFALKAPNDLYLNGNKLAGILIENLQQGSKNKLIIGIGLNVLESPVLPRDAQPQATALINHCDLSTKDWEMFLERLFHELKVAVTNSELELSLNDQLSALHALNQNPNLKDKYILLEPNGSLVLTNSKIHWRDL